MADPFLWIKQLDIWTKVAPSCLRLRCDDDMMTDEPFTFSGLSVFPSFRKPNRKIWCDFLARRKKKSIAIATTTSSRSGVKRQSLLIYKKKKKQAIGQQQQQRRRSRRPVSFSIKSWRHRLDTGIPPSSLLLLLLLLLGLPPPPAIASRVCHICKSASKRLTPRFMRPFSFSFPLLLVLLVVIALTTHHPQHQIAPPVQFKKTGQNI